MQHYNAGIEARRNNESRFAPLSLFLDHGAEACNDWFAGWDFADATENVEEALAA